MGGINRFQLTHLYCIMTLMPSMISGADSEIGPDNMFRLLLVLRAKKLVSTGEQKATETSSPVVCSVLCFVYTFTSHTG